MKIKDTFSRIFTWTHVTIIAVLLLVSATDKVLAQTCSQTANIPPNGTFSTNGVTVTSASTGVVNTYNAGSFTSCNNVTTGNNSLWVGGGNNGNYTAENSGPWSTTLTFSQPVNDIVIVLTATGHDFNEKFKFLSNAGTISITSSNNCYTTIYGDSLVSGFGSPAASGGGGIFRLRAPAPFTKLVMRGLGGNNGSMLAICSASITPAPATPVPTGTNPTTPGASNGSVSLSPATGSYPANTPVLVTYTNPSGTTVTHTGTTTGSGQIVIPNLPAGTYNNFTVALNGGPASSPSGPVTLTDPAPAPATPVPTGTNPTTPGASNGSVSLSPATGSYPANTPVSVTYTNPSGTTVTYTGTSNGSGQIVIPNLPAGTYNNFKVAVNGGPASSPSGPVTLTDPAPACAADAGIIIRQ